MTRKQYIRRTIIAMCGDRPAHPQTYYQVSGMADRANAVNAFDPEQN